MNGYSYNDGGAVPRPTTGPRTKSSGQALQIFTAFYAINSGSKVNFEVIHIFGCVHIHTSLARAQIHLL